MVETSPAPLTGVLIWEQSLTYQYWEFPVPGIFHCFGGIRKIWYREKVLESIFSVTPASVLVTKRDSEGKRKKLN